jgi:hypothetical protein
MKSETWFLPDREFVQRRVAEITPVILDKADELNKITGPKKQRKNPGFKLHASPSYFIGGDEQEEFRGFGGMKREVSSWKGEKRAAIGVSNLMLHSSPFFLASEQVFEELGL